MPYNLCITLLIGSAGGFLGYKSKIPAGGILGALIATTAYSVLTHHAAALISYKILAQIIAGFFIGMQLGKANLKSISKLWGPILVTVAGMLCINVIIGIFLHAISSMDLMTALFASTPGGIADMTMISEDMGANTIQVSLLQFARLLFSLCVFPQLAKFVADRQTQQTGSFDPDEPIPDTHTQNASIKTVLMVFMLASISGILGYYSGIPGGTLVFPMVCVAALSHFNICGKADKRIKPIAQTLSGIYIGSTATLSDITGLKELILPAAVLLFGYFVLCILLSFLLHKAFKIKLYTALFSCIPAGVSDMALVASDYGNAGPTVSILQLARYASVVAFCPSIILFLSHLLR